jgi:hypothetical protein
MLSGEMARTLPEEIEQRIKEKSFYPNDPWCEHRMGGDDRRCAELHEFTPREVRNPWRADSRIKRVGR